MPLFSTLPRLPLHRPAWPKLLIGSVLCAMLSSAALAGTWTRHQTQGESPSARSTPAVSALGNEVYVFGGVFDDFSTGIDTFYNDLFRFDVVRQSWVKLQPSGLAPAPRGFAAAVSHPGTGQFFVFGGSSYGAGFADFTVFDDLWAYSTRTNSWTRVQASNAGPAGRSRPASWMVGHKLYLFGGITASFSTLNDLWSYDLHTNAWTELIANGAPGSPPPRHEAAAGLRHRAGVLSIYGGETLGEAGFELLGDFWEYDLARNRWQEVTPSALNNLDPARNFAAVGIVGGNFYLHGGDLPGGSDCCGAPFPQNASGELWKFDLQQKLWSEVTQFRGESPVLKRHRGVEVGNQLFLFGGYDFQPENEVGQVWNREVYSFRP